MQCQGLYLLTLQPPTPAPCPDTCEIYGKAVDSLIRSPACPNIESLHSQPDYYTRVESRRTVLKTASVSCKDIIASWSSGVFAETQSRPQKFSSGGFGWDYQKDVYGKPETCPPDSFILGVDDDTQFCGCFQSNFQDLLVTWK